NCGSENNSPLLSLFLHFQYGISDHLMSKHPFFGRVVFFDLSFPCIGKFKLIYIIGFYRLNNI
ncbi:MAG: hypothetical protein AAGU75_20695, partial [Bacillota bacterium]